MSQSSQLPDSDQTHAWAEFAFGSHTQVVDVSRPLAWLSPEEMNIDLSDPVQRRFGDYELIEKVGQGGMGVVYRARQHGLERDVAIKLLAAGPWASEEFVARFRREARSAARMQHPNIVEVYEFGHRDGLNYFSMRLIEGQTLAQRLYEKGPMQAGEAARLLRTIAEAMDYAHRLGVLHLDLKPGNVLMAANDIPLIADFGLARRIDAGHDGDSNEISGSPSYMAPEQAMLESHPLSARATDIYGLGAVLYEMLTGRPPFMGTDPQSTLERVVAEQPAAPRSLRKSVPQDLEAICLKCLAKNPAERYASAHELADDLGRFLDGRAVSVRSIGSLERVARWFKREPRLAAALVAAAMALLLGSAATTWQWRQAAAHRDAAEKAERFAKSERDRATIASELGAYLYAYGGDSKDTAGRARSVISWLRKRFPNDEARQADALTGFAKSVGDQSPHESESLLYTIIEVLGVDYRHQVIKALQAGTDRNRYVYSAMLAWGDTNGSSTSGQFDSALRAAVAAQPEDPFVWQVAAVFCPEGAHEKRCLYPQAAESLVRIAPDNMYHWLLLLASSTDESRQREALHEAARRTKFDDYMAANYNAYARAIDAGNVRVPALVARPILVLAPGESPERSMALLEGGSIPLPDWSPLMRYCGAAARSDKVIDAETRADCLTVGERMMRSKSAIISQMIGVALVRNLARNTPQAEEALQARRNYDFLESMDGRLEARQRMSYSATRFLQDISSVGEMAALQRRVEFFGMPGRPPAGWTPEDPNELLSSRERLDSLSAIGNAANVSVAQGKYADAVRSLLPIETATRKYFHDRDAWRLPAFLMTPRQGQNRPRAIPCRGNKPA